MENENAKVEESKVETPKAAKPRKPNPAMMARKSRIARQKKAEEAKAATSAKIIADAVTAALKPTLEALVSALPQPKR